MIPGTGELPAAPTCDALTADFEAFNARFASLFARSEPREQAIKYVRSLMGTAARRNGWQLAEAIGDRTPDRVQRLLYGADWSADAARVTLGMMALAWLAFMRAKFPDEGAFPYAPAINAEFVHQTALPVPGEKAEPMQLTTRRALGEKSAPRPKGATLRRRWLPGAFPKSAA
jgi:hypothetical protein